MFNKGKLTPDHHRNRARNETLPLKVDRREKKKFYSKEISREKEEKEDQEKRKPLKNWNPQLNLNTNVEEFKFNYRL